MGFPAKKGLGQHFLKDESVIERIVQLAGLRSSDCVLEIGPGLGALTIPLARAAGSVTAVEKDEALADELVRRISAAGVLNVGVIKADILKWDLEEMQCERFHVIGNLPYYVSKPVLEKLLRNRKRLKRALVMLQREVADRLTALPGSKQYGALTLMIQYHARAEMLLRVSSSAFFPRPKVESAVVELDFERPYPKRFSNEDLLYRVIKGAFSHRRKTVFNSLQRYFTEAGKSSIARALELAGVPPSARAETLSMDDFMRLAATMDLTINQ